MVLQTNPYLVWQLIPGITLAVIGLYILSRPVKRRESNAFITLMLGGSLWAFADAIQVLTPDMAWQSTWSDVKYVGIMLIPTAWLLLAVNLTNLPPPRIRKYDSFFWVIPALTYLALLSNDYHRFFFKTPGISTEGGYVVLEFEYGTLFFVHTTYSYAALSAGIILLAISLATRFRNYGLQAYGLIIGVLAPMMGNIYFLFGSPPPGFPDPTPLLFTVTGIAFAWAIFGGRILEVVPLAHETIVRKLSTGILILDADKNIRDINDAARGILGLSYRTYAGDPLAALVEKNPELAVLSEALDLPAPDSRQMLFVSPATQRTFDLRIARVGEEMEQATGWLIQFTDISGEKRAEENVIATQKTMKVILDTLQDNIFEADPSGKLTYANKSFIKNLGFSKWEEVQGKNFRNFTDRKSVREIFDKFKTLYETKQPLEPFQYHYRTRDGRTLIGETTVSPIMDGEEVIGSRGVIRDISARVKAEREIMEQKELLDGLMQQSPIAMVINDTQKRITVVNPAFERMFGYSQEETIGKSLEELLSLPGETENINDLSSVFIKRHASYEGRRRKKDGTPVDVEIFTAPFFVGGEQFGYLAFYNDISERLKAEANFQKTQTSYFAVLETFQDPYFEVSRAGVFIYVNQALCDINGYSKEELLGRHFRIVASRKSVRETALKFEAMFEDGKPLPPFEFIYRRKNGREFGSEMVVSPIFEDGVVVGGRGIIRDISLRLQAEEILRQAKEAAEFRVSELDAINRVAEKVVQSLDLKEILQAVCKELASIFPVRNAGIGLLTPDRKNLEIIAFHTDQPHESSALGLLLPLEGNTSSLEVISKKKTVVVQDAQSDSRTSSIADVSRQRGTKSIIIVPLLARGEAIGTIGMPALDPNYTFTKNEIDLAETIASQIATAVDNAQLHAKTELALGAAERDLEIGRQIQSGFFPEKLPSLPGWELATHFHAAKQVAGDFYDVFKLKDSNLVAFIIADVCDKGVGAALFMVLFRSLLRAFSGMQVDEQNVRERLLNTILSTNNFIAEQHGKSNMFATLFFGVLDPITGNLHYVNGGHEPPILLDKDGAIVQRLMPTGPAVGMFVDMEFRVEEVHFREGDVLFAFTDGTTDAKNTSGNQFTEQRLLKTIGAPWTSVFSMLFELNVELQKHIGEQSQFDDITLLSFRRKSGEEMNHHAICRPAQMKVLPELRNFVESSAKVAALPSEHIFAFKLAADELCANIIQYGFADREPGLISLSFHVQENTARLFIRDDGNFFAPEQAHNPDIEAGWEERQMGGLGIYFVKELMDNVTYNRQNDKFNQIVLEKIFNRPKE
ncbi:MAG: PAS domain S-box protein [Chloroflexi bacterium CFX2]|nr:PAS domain S-box protein [Chloroflexi bacterium CFX2]